jgi:hypothetical protein
MSHETIVAQTSFCLTNNTLKELSMRQNAKNADFLHSKSDRFFGPKICTKTDSILLRTTDPLNH